GYARAARRTVPLRGRGVRGDHARRGSQEGGGRRGDAARRAQLDADRHPRGEGRQAARADHGERGRRLVRPVDARRDPLGGAADQRRGPRGVRREEGGSRLRAFVPLRAGARGGERQTRRVSGRQDFGSRPPAPGSPGLPAAPRSSAARRRETTSPGYMDSHTAEETATPRAPAATSASMLLGPMPPMARWGGNLGSYSRYLRRYSTPATSFGLVEEGNMGPMPQ